MALPILDGNQTATTLSTVLTSGEHIPAHTVVSLGSVAISNITSAVSGSVVSVSNFPASQSTTFGAVTGSVSVLNLPSTQTIAGTVTANGGDFCGGFGGGLPSQLVAVAGYDAPNGELGPVPIYQGLADEVTRAVGIRGTVTANSTAQKYFSISAVTANRSIIGYSSSGGNQFTEWDGSVDAEIVINGSSWSNANPAPVSVANSVTIGSLPAISGTVTANVFGLDVPNGTIAQIPVHNYDEGFAAGNKAIPVLIGNENGGFNSSQPLPISGTVTADNPNGALTTRFGSVATANLAFITSAVTNTSRKYLLAQNISAGTVTIGIGFSPTTTQGIQLAAGGGLTFDAFCPTGAVYWLGAVTGAAFTILEG